MFENWPIVAYIADNKLFITAFASVLGLVGNMLLIRRQTQAFQTYIAMEFFKRYSAISETLPDRLRLAKYVADDSPLSDEEWRQITRSMIQYGNLCSEEFMLWKAGRIPEDIWRLWASSMRENFETKIWRDAWAAVEREYASFSDFAAFMKGLMADAQRQSSKATVIVRPAAAG